MIFFASPLIFAQSAVTPPAQARESATVHYPDSTSGLVRLAKDVLNAQENNDGGRAGSLLESLVLPNPAEWYAQNFEGAAAREAESMYEANVKSMPIRLAQFFVGVHARKQKEIVAVRFEKTCDDNASDQTFGILESRLQKVPLYELRFFSGDHFTRLFAFAYVDGGFRFIIPPDEEQLVSRGPAADRQGQDEKGRPNPPEKQLERVKRGGTVQAAKLTHRVKPEYPPLARAEHLQGTVRMHAVIGKDGAIRELRVMKGACSLARAAVEAVKQWRYSPTLLEGRPIEVDTTIDVIFALNY